MQMETKPREISGEMGHWSRRGGVAAGDDSNDTSNGRLGPVLALHQNDTDAGDVGSLGGLCWTAPSMNLAGEPGPGSTAVSD